jgi:peptide/nickel transport system permease protein
MDFAGMMANAFLVELVFRFPGLSQYGVNAMLNKDLNAIVAVVMIIGILFVTVNTIVDIVVAYLDPRIRMGRRKV